MTPETSGEATAAAGAAVPASGPEKRGNRKAFVGRVKSTKMDKTITVVVESLVRHPVYEKFVKKRKSLHAHDETNEARVGDTVEIVSTRPLSKLKRFRLAKIIHRAPVD